MRYTVGWALLLIAGCASDKLALAPPASLDLSGHWVLNEADSDDPQRVAQSQTVTGAQNQSSGGGQGGRGGGHGGRGSAGGVPGNYGPTGPALPAAGLLADGLRWPGKDLQVEQTGGIVTIASMGSRQIYQPIAATLQKPGHSKSDEPRREGRDRVNGPPPICGWDDKTLVVQSENPDDEHPPFEERYSLSEDGLRLIEVVAFKGGRSGGFTVSRVWDRAPVPPAGSGSNPQSP